MENLFKGLFDTELTTVISVANFLLCIVVSLVIGLFLAFVSMYKSHYTKGYVVTLAMLPAIVCVVIMLVNGNVGAGVAVAGAFSLVRFRSVPGTANEICMIFLAMGAGLVAGMGYLGFAVLFAVLMGCVMLLYQRLGIGNPKSEDRDKTLHVTIPEDLDYSGIFDDLFEKYTEKHEITDVKTTNMGSMFKLKYNLTLKNTAQEKEFIDEIRCRNGNLEVAMSKQEVQLNEL